MCLCVLPFLVSVVLRYPLLWLPGSAVGLGVKSRHNIQPMEMLALPVVSLSVQTPLLKCLLPVLQQTSPLGQDCVAMPSRIQDPWGIGIGGGEVCWTGNHQCLLQGTIESCKHGTIWSSDGRIRQRNL